jgi:general secretion pathway protein I
MRNATHLKQQGFTLTEVLVAMAILSTAIIGALVLISQHVRAATDIEARLMAEIVAENVLVEAMSNQAAPEIATRRGESDVGGSVWTWERQVQQTTIPGMLRITVNVRRKDEEQLIKSVSAFRKVDQ